MGHAVYVVFRVESRVFVSLKEVVSDLGRVISGNLTVACARERACILFVHGYHIRQELPKRKTVMFSTSSGGM